MNLRVLALLAAVAVVATYAPTVAQRGVSSGSEQTAPGWGAASSTVLNRDALRARASDDRRLAAYYDWPSPLDEPLQGVAHVLACAPAIPPPPPGEEIVRPEYRAFLKTVACRYDAIAVGGAARRRVMLNESESAVFTEYSLSVEQWIRPAAGERVVRVSRSGGLATLADGSAIGIEFNGSTEPYGRRLFMLNRIPGTSDFDIAQSFEIAAGYVQPRFAEISFGYMPEELLTAAPVDAVRFLRDLALAGTNCPVAGR